MVPYQSSHQPEILKKNLKIGTDWTKNKLKLTPVVHPVEPELKIRTDWTKKSKLTSVSTVALWFYSNPLDPQFSFAFSRCSL